MANFEKYRLLGCPCVSLSSVEMTKKILNDLISNHTSGYTVAINAEKIMRYKSDQELFAAIEKSVLPYPDGAGAVLALKWLYGKKSIKLDMPKTALDLANTNGWRLFVLGAREDVNSTACDTIRKRYPNIQIAGRLHGFGSEDEMLQSIQMAAPQIVFMALGSPKQEMLACRMQDMQLQTLIIGCGGALDVLAGQTKRAPEFMINNNLEWLYRLYKQPSRWRRQLKLVVFLYKLMIEKVIGRQAHLQ